MPIQLAISHGERALTAVCTGTVRLADLEAYFDAVAVAEAKSYRKLFDIRGAGLDISDSEMFLLGARVQAYRGTSGETLGPVAIVAPEQRSYDNAHHFAALADAERPLAIFRDLTKAREWLAAQQEGSASR